MSVLGKQEAVFQVSVELCLEVSGTFDYHLAFWTSVGITGFSIFYSLYLHRTPPLESRPETQRAFWGFFVQISRASL